MVVLLLLVLITAKKKNLIATEDDEKIRDRMVGKYDTQLKEMKREVATILRDGYSPALMSLNGHSLAVTRCAWMNDPLSSRPDRYRVLTSSWDQKLCVFDIDCNRGSR